MYLLHSETRRVHRAEKTRGQKANKPQRSHNILLTMLLYPTPDTSKTVLSLREGRLEHLFSQRQPLLFLWAFGRELLGQGPGKALDGDLPPVPFPENVMM